MQREVLYRRGADEFTLRLDVEAGALRSSYQGNAGGSGFRSVLAQDLWDRALFRDEVLRAHGFTPEKPVESLFEREPAVGVDIDGTLAQRREGEGERGPFEFARVGEDLVNEMVAHVVELLRADGLKVVLLSGRQEEFRPETEEWLRRNDLPYDALVMRPLADRRRDDVVKRELYLTRVKPFWDLRVMLDDRQRVVDMWRDLGEFPCWQVAAGNF